MGMLRDGHATSANHAPSLGRGLGVGSSTDMLRSNGPMADMPGMHMTQVPKDANTVPLFPQDAFMEGSMMAMDKDVDKPENYGLPPGWSGFVGGMMTLVRVLPPDQFENIMALKARQGSGAR